MPKHEPEEQRGLFPEPRKPAEKKEPMVYIVKANSRASRCRGPNCNKVVFWHYGTQTGRTTIVDCKPEYPANSKKYGQPHPMAERCFPPIHPMASGPTYGHGMDGQGIDHHLTCHDVAQFGGRKTNRRQAE
jgi:hypothetical protein